MASLTSNTPPPNANPNVNSNANSEISADRILCDSNTESLQVIDEKYSKTIIQNTSKQDVFFLLDDHAHNIRRSATVSPANLDLHVSP